MTAKEFLIENGLDSELADKPEVLDLLESNLEAFAKQQREQYFEELFGDTPNIVELRATTRGRNFYKRILKKSFDNKAISESQYVFLNKAESLKIVKTEQPLCNAIPRKFIIELYTKK